MNRKICSLAFCSLLAFEWSAYGADVPVPRDTVVDRARPELDPQGVQVGAFTAFPQVSTFIGHDDNIYADSSNEVDDVISVLSPRIELQSNWSRHSLNLSAEADIGRYADNSSEDYEDVRLAAKGRVEIDSTSSLRFSGRFDSLHDDRFSPDDRDGFEPTEFDRRFLATGYERKAGKVTLRLDAEIMDLNYRDGTGLNGVIDNDDRDRDASRASFQASYEFAPDSDVFVRGAVTEIDYDSGVDDNGFARSSNGSELTIGARLHPSAVTSLEGFVGVASRDYDDDALDDIDTAMIGGRFIWRVSGLTTVTSDLSRRIEETTQNDASGYVATRLGASVDHELLRNLILHFSMYRQDNEYEGIAREDDIIGTRIAAKYIVNRYLVLDVSYTGRDRDIDDAQPAEEGYDTGVLGLGFTGRL